MTILPQNSQETLCGEILAEARRESDEIVRRARQEGIDVLAKATAEADQTRRERLDQARTEAAHRRELILATVVVEAGRLRLARVEALLEAIHAEVRQQLLARNSHHPDTTITLAAEAIRQMPGKAFVVKLSPADRPAVAEGFVEAVCQRAGRSPLEVRIAYEPAIPAGGLRVEDVDGRQVWDNGLLVRLERFWPELRRQIAVRTALVGDGAAAGGAK